MSTVDACWVVARMTSEGTPRTWTLKRRFGEPFKVEGPDDERGPIKVIEAEPVLDLLERVRDWMVVYDQRSLEPIPEALIDREAVDALLRAHDRLKGADDE